MGHEVSYHRTKNGNDSFPQYSDFSLIIAVNEWTKNMGMAELFWFFTILSIRINSIWLFNTFIPNRHW